MSEDMTEWEIETYATEREMWGYTIYRHGETFHSTTDGGWLSPSRGEALEAAQERIESATEGCKAYKPRRDRDLEHYLTMKELAKSMEPPPQFTMVERDGQHSLWWVPVALISTLIGAAIACGIHAWMGY